MVGISFIVLLVDLDFFYILKEYRNC